MNNIEIASDAIRMNRRIQLIYRGHTRKVEAHSVGMSKKGHPSMLVYQVEGGSNSHEEQGWKALNMDKVTSIIILDEPSEAPRSGYGGGMRGMVEVFAHVPAPSPEEQEAEAEAQAEALAKALAQLKVQG